jgi:hypothetical protein
MLVLQRVDAIAKAKDTYRSAIITELVLRGLAVEYPDSPVALGTVIGGNGPEDFELFLQWARTRLVRDARARARDLYRDYRAWVAEHHGLSVVLDERGFSRCLRRLRGVERKRGAGGVFYTVGLRAPTPGP